MNDYQTIFSAADILIPSFSTDPEAMKRWAVIACDQFTSDPAYWDSCRRLTDGSSSAYDYILPEAYLGTDLETTHGAEVDRNMKNFQPDSMQLLKGMMLVERTLPNGSVRHGLIGKLDLEQYDYSTGSQSPVRATEATVLERIPPRCKIRAAASIELPHILILIDDHCGVFELAEKLKTDSVPAYDFDLMLGGGHIRGYGLTGSVLERMEAKISEYERTSGSVVYAMGDGNHSLAAAKAHWENVKRETGNLSHPARWALCEITALADESLVFEPIYRVVKNCDPNDLLGQLDGICGEGEQKVIAVTADGRTEKTFVNPSHALTVGTLQNFLDAYLKEHPGVTCDYIHGEDSLVRLSQNPGCVGFLMDGMNKNDLFGYVEAHGTLPRKTFSMGEAESKRYYLEARAIVR